MSLEEYKKEALECLHKEIKDKANIGPFEKALLEDAEKAYNRGHTPKMLALKISTGL